MSDVCAVLVRDRFDDTIGKFSGMGGFGGVIWISTGVVSISLSIDGA